MSFSSPLKLMTISSSCAKSNGSTFNGSFILDLRGHQDDVAAMALNRS